MSTHVRSKTSSKQVIRYRRKRRIRAIIQGTAERPRLTVFRSNRNLFVQLIDDVNRRTLAAASTLEDELKGKVRSTVDGAKTVGNLIAKRAQAKKISEIIFDRSGYLYHGKIKALADGAREGGLKF